MFHIPDKFFVLGTWDFNLHIDSAPNDEIIYCRRHFVLREFSRRADYIERAPLFVCLGTAEDVLVADLLPEAIAATVAVPPMLSFGVAPAPCVAVAVTLYDWLPSFATIVGRFPLLVVYVFVPSLTDQELAVIPVAGPYV